MAKKDEQRRESGQAEEVDWNDERLADARRSGNAARIPSGVRFSAYPRSQIDQGTRQVIGADDAGGPAMGAGAGAVTDDVPGGTPGAATGPTGRASTRD